MFCTKCGKQQITEAKFCHGCGVGHECGKVDQEEPSNPVATIHKQQSAETSTASPVREFYVVSVGKFIVLTISTFGLYPIFWFAKNWILIKDQEHSNISPNLRGIFGVFFFSELGKKVLKSAEYRGYKRSYSPNSLAILYFISGIIFRASDYFWLLGFGGVLCFIPVLEAILFNNEKSVNSVSNFEKYRLGEIITLVIGVMIWLLFLVGLMS